MVMSENLSSPVSKTNCSERPVNVLCLLHGEELLHRRLQFGIVSALTAGAGHQRTDQRQDRQAATGRHQRLRKN
jgi:hypothetical protein